MKDAKFIELLNLYVDHQITAADAALLEAEIQRSPERRRIYREYCQMQKACALLAENFATPARAGGGKVVDFPRAARSPMKFATYAMGALAAAACVAVVFVQRDRFSDADSMGSPVAGEVATMVAASATAPAMAAPAATLVSTRPALQPAFGGLVRQDSPVNTALAASVPLDWMNRVQLQRVPAQELWFESRPAAQPGELIFRSRRPNDAQTTLAAFRFQR